MAKEKPPRKTTKKLKSLFTTRLTKAQIIISVIFLIIISVIFLGLQVQTNTPEPSPTPNPTLAISTHQPNKLVVTRQEDTTFHLTALSITVSNPALVKKIFDDILQLPLYAGNYKCPQDYANPPTYTLAFYQDNKLPDTAIYRTTGCATVTIDNYPPRLDNGSLSSFDTDFQQAVGLSGQSLYGNYP